MPRNTKPRQRLGPVAPGERFRRLTVVSDDGCDRVRCVCDCGAARTVARHCLRNGNTSSCGCLQRDTVRSYSTKHGGSGTDIHRICAGIIQRCENPKNPDFVNYGARGITICERWRKSFEAFRDDVGPRPSLQHSVDRIDNEGGYAPDNVAWRTRAEQNSNSRHNRILEHRGVRLNVTQWSERLGVPANRIYKRLESGWSVERSLTEPPHIALGFTQQRTNEMSK